MTSMKVFLIGAATAILIVAAFALREGASKTEPSPAVASRAGVYAFDLYPEGQRLHMLLVEYAGRNEAPSLLYTRSDDGGEAWSAPVRVDQGAPPAFVPYRGVDPQLAGRGDKVVAVWTAAGDDLYGYGTGPLATAVSVDGGKTWKPGPNPADDGLMTAHEFLDVMADAEGRFHLIWIDDRDDQEGIRRGLRYSHSEDGGRNWSANETLDQHICGCCWTHLRSDAAGKLYILYRDEHPDPSDMKILTSPNGGLEWSDQGYVGAFGWMQNGCPHTTAGMALLGPLDSPEIHALVQTGKEGLEGVYHLWSRDGAVHWSEPARIAEAGAHYSDLAANGKLLGAIWQGQQDSRTVVYGRLSTDGGSSWTEPEMISDPATFSSYPRIVPSGNAFRVFWTESSDGAIHRRQGARFGDSPPPVAQATE